MANVLEVSDLTKRFGGLIAADNVTFSVAEGEIVGLIGANGAGKTTVFNMLAGAIRPTAGSIRLRGQECAGLPSHKMAKLGIARTFQNTSLFPDITVLENLTAAGHLVGHAPGKDEATTFELDEVVQFLGLGDHVETLAKNLSYGDQRKLAIGIALLTAPTLLLLDEPAAGMSPEEARKLIDTITTLRDRGITILLVDHHMKVVMRVCDRIVVLDHGVKIAEGAPQQVASDKAVIDVYFGRKAENAHG